MDSKKLQAKLGALKAYRSEMGNKMHGGMGDELKKKKGISVTVAAPDEEGLKEGLSMAEKLMAAKFGKVEEQKGLDLFEDESSEESCPMCGDEECLGCEEDSLLEE